MKLAEIMPLTPVQDGLLYASSLDPADADPYIVQADIGLHGALDPVLLQRSAQAVFDRHPNLRAAFRRRKNGEPVALILDGARIGWTEHDLSGSPQAHRYWAALGDAERDRRFDLASPPLLRLTLGRFGEDRWRLLFTHHHLLLDGWSSPLLLREIVLTYADGGSTAALPAVRQFRDYLAWLDQQDTAAALARWTQLLDGTATATMIAHDDGAGLGGRPREVRCDGLGDLGDRLAARARTAGLTLGSLLQTAWGLTLGLHTGLSDVLFGATVSGRSPEFSGAETVIGMTIGAIPVRVRAHGDHSLLEIAATVQHDQAQVLNDHWVGLPAIAGAAGMSALFDTLLVVENHPASSAALNQAFAAAGLTPDGISPRDSTHYPLTVQAIVEPELQIRLHHLPAAVSEHRAGRLARTLIEVLTRLADDPAATAAALRADGPDEVAALLQQGTGPKPESTELAALLQPAGAAADRLIVRDDHRALTADALEQRVTALSTRLREAGAGADAVVAIALPRSVDSLTAVLAVLRAGAAVLPLDLEYPRDLLAYTLADARPAVVLTTAQTRLPDHDAAVIRVDELRSVDMSPTQPVSAPPVYRAGDLAYLVYTSGSTGLPKAVAGTRDGLAVRLSWAGRLWPARPGEIRLAKSSLAFIDGLTELLGAFTAGATIVMADDAQRTDPAAQALLLTDAGINQLTAVPSLAATLAGIAPAACAGLTRWILSGEPLRAGVVADLARVSPHAQLVNSYGSSEVVGDVTVAELATEDVTAAESASIGRPVPGTSVVLLDDLLRPVPRGTMGEIYLAGRQVVRGYLHRPALTAERFVANPFGPGRLYRTGDLGRWRRDGRLEFHGRTDGQVKIRGHRVETAGIEASLQQIPGVTAAAVAGRTDAAGTQGLWAYVTVAGGPGAPTAADIQRALAERVPAPQVPAVLLLEELPSLPNGKVNRRALPDPQTLAPTPGRSPVTPTEHTLAQIFADLLGVGAVGADDDFFALGGHSLLATRLAHRAATEWGVELPIRSVFDQPSPALLAAEIDRLRAEPDRSRPVPLTRPDPLPASPAQQGVWSAEQLTAAGSGRHGAAYHLPFRLRLHGPLDAAALRAAAADLVDRHEALRTVLFTADDGRLHMRIQPAGTVPEFAVHRGPQAPAALNEAAGRPFAPATDLPLRVDVAELTAHEHLLQLTVHHTAADEWCAPLLFDDLAEHYRHRLAGGAPAGPDPAVQYADAVAWQTGELDRPGPDGITLRDRERAFWAQTLRAAPDELALPYDHRRPEHPTGRGGTVDFTVDARLGAALQALALAHRATGFMIAHAALVTVLHQLTGSRDLPVGTPVANRTHPDLQGVVGMFTNTVVLRTVLDDDPTVAELIAQVREVDLAALEHQLLPFAEIVEAVDPPRRYGRNPLFQTMLQYRGPVPEPEFAGLTAGVEPSVPSWAKFDLTVELLEHTGGPGLSGRIEFSSDLFQRETVERIAAMLVTALEQMAAAPQAPLAGLDLTPPADRLQIAGFNDTARTVADTDLPDLFARTVAAHPQVPAVIAGTDRLTYAQMAAAVDRLGRRLRAVGAGVDGLVAVDLPRSAALLVTVLAAHRIGAAYLPLDRDLPPARRRFLLEDAAPAVLVTDRTDLPDEGIPAVRVDTRGTPVGGPSLASGPAALPAPGSLPSGRAAYLLYTSGSTGTPKAVVVDQRAIVNRLEWMQDRFALVPGEPVLHKTPTGFDVSVWELLWPVLAGATVVMADPGAHRDPVRLAQLLTEHRITTVHFVPSMLRAFLAETAQPLPQLRRILCSGEALTAPLRDGVRDRFPTAALHNLYGPTEAAVDVTEIDLTGTSGPQIPIGRPVWNTGLHVLGPDLRERPLGMWGDLYLSGVQLARGYAGRPGLTASAFVASPFSGTGDRMYRTGDIARWTAAGVVEYAGRSDGQLKLRGQRVEPGEIEQALLATGRLAQAVAIGHTTADGRTVLAAYGVAADPHAAVDVPALLAEAAATLPAHLVPATVTMLDALPVTVNGKLDRSRLPDPVTVRSGAAVDGAAEESAAQESAAEQTVAEVFGQVLHLPEAMGVHREDDFFALGGDSIVAITVINRLRRRGLEVDIAQIFTDRTVAALAAAARPVAVAPAPAASIERTRPLPLTPITARLAARSGRWQSLTQSMTVVLPDAIDPARVTAVLDTVLRRHEALRQQVEVDRNAAGMWTVHCAPPGSPAAADVLTVQRRTDTPTPDEFADLAASAQARLDPATGRCLQAVAVLTPAAGWLILVAHHLAVDVVSWRILLDDLAEADAALSAGSDPALPPPATGYAAYTDAVHAKANGREMIAEATRWRTTLAGAAPLWPDAVPGVQDELRSTTVTLTAPETTGFLTAESVTAHFVAAVAGAIDRWRTATGHAPEPFLIDVEGHGRDLLDDDLSETVGWLTALWPVRYDPADPGPAALLPQLAQPGYGYGLARYANPRTARVLSRSPRAQVLVNYLGVLDLSGDAGPWRPAPASRWTRTTPEPDLSVDHPLTVDGRVQRDADGTALLTVELTWSSTVLSTDDLAALTSALHRELTCPGADRTGTMT
ncbi:putative non-ribosomal peptide synthetase [Gordonia hirsuta DSM 44140 = NBRC 16056]|uniref:Putative non-ribosomal peptide synthetase n=1 Tax=Gordonia hirsuta DSM 44140 = NBRC 16056 TaxID=1121927 RepID=L7LF04_9ACTN|nr:non-ribosomal peptide synthetase [Gordonia hirsuta]GAC58633.1 putative non-ribosomal peptide synthetase [Gordonia hirsuta DSM 44140 = NBRC 16056]